MSLPAIHRVVTGHAADGRAVVASDGPLPTVVELSALPGVVFHEVWNTQGTPAPLGNGPDPTLDPLRLPPPQAGTRIRFVDIPPDTAELILAKQRNGPTGTVKLRFNKACTRFENRAADEYEFNDLDGFQEGSY